MFYVETVIIIVIIVSSAYNQHDKVKYNHML